MARPDTSVRARLRQVQARSGAAVSLCDRLGGLEVRDTGAVLLFSGLVRSLKQRTRSLVHFYCGITEARGLPGYVYTSRWVSALQHCSTAALQHCSTVSTPRVPPGRTRRSCCSTWTASPRTATSCCAPRTAGPCAGWWPASSR